MPFKLNWKSHIKIYTISIIIALVLREPIQVMVLESAINIYKVTGINLNLFYFVWVFLYLAAIMTPITVIHELLHSLVHRRFGGRVRIGFKGIYAYCQEISGIQLSRTQFLLVLLMPVTVISIVSMLLSY